jgi:hypothetical protein
VPLISDSPQDLAVVRELLSEHYPWLAPDPDDEFDATDPTDKDLLFGALARELGAVRRGETLFQTIKLALGRRVARLASPIRTRLADSYAAVNHALHPLVQYLHHRWSGATELLTSRGRGERYASTSRKLLRDVAAGDPKRQPALRARLIWLSRFFPRPIVERRQVVIRRAIVATLGVAVLAAVGLAIKRSIDYHPTYVERIEAQERDLAARRANQANQQKGASDGEAPQADQARP